MDDITRMIRLRDYYDGKLTESEAEALAREIGVKRMLPRDPGKDATTNALLALNAMGDELWLKAQREKGRQLREARNAPPATAPEPEPAPAHTTGHSSGGERPDVDRLMADIRRNAEAMMAQFRTGQKDGGSSG
ncbi:hypothetical protein P7L75_06155 (plasmid) [Tistrella mobilis]|uniref:hypothetical protein n=1 Tax=Tistrella mobilis TaxID=171437 RepID=UPI003557B2A8